MEALRTPDERFENLDGFNFEPHYLDDLPGYEGLRMHYLDEAQGERTYLCLHGEPSWSYLYRKLIPILKDAGGRVVAPDFFGFGRSDKPVDDAVYTYDFHRGALTAFFERVIKGPVTLVCQDWGGILGLSLPMDYPQIDQIFVMNTAIPTGKRAPTPGFIAWRDFMANQKELDVAALMTRSIPGLSESEAAAYAAPFPDGSYQGGVRRFPAIVPTSEDMQGASTSLKAKEFFQNEWSGKAFMAIGMQDPVLGPPVMHKLHRVILGCAEPMEVAACGHFVQEHAEDATRAALAHFAS